MQDVASNPELKLLRDNREIIRDEAQALYGIGTDVTLIGMNDHLEMWKKADWARQQAELKKEKEQQSGQTPPVE